MAYDGRGQPANAAEAAKWFRQAAEHGNSAAQHLLAGLYEQGEGVARNEPEALKWYRKAAEQEDSDSQFALGQMYAEGRGTAANPAEAARWWQRAAHAEHSGAADRLAALLETDPSLKNKVRALAPAATQQLIARATKGEGAAQYELARDYLDGGGWLLVDEAEAGAVARQGRRPRQRRRAKSTGPLLRRRSRSNAGQRRRRTLVAQSRRPRPAGSALQSRTPAGRCRWTAKDTAMKS